MPPDNRLELVIEIDPSKGNANIKTVNKSLTDLEKQAADSAGKMSGSLEKSWASIAKGVLAGNVVFAAFKQAYETLKGLVMGAPEQMAQLGLTAQKVGLTVEELSKLSYVAKATTIDSDVLTKSVGFLSKNMLMAAQGAATQQKHFRELHLEYKNADGTLRSALAVFTEMADRFKTMPEGAAKVGFAMQLLGRSGKEMIPVLNMGGDAIRAMMEEASAFGLVVTKETAESAHHFEENIKRLQLAVSGLAFKIADELLPKMIEFTDSMVKWIREGGIDKVIAYIKDALPIIERIGVALVSLFVIKTITQYCQALIPVMTGLNAVLWANPWVLVAAGVVTFGIALWDQKKKADEAVQSFAALNREFVAMKALREGKTVPEIERQFGFTEEEMRYAVTHGQKVPDFGAGPFATVKGRGESWQAPAGALGFEADSENARLEKFMNEQRDKSTEFLRTTMEATTQGAGAIKEVLDEIHRLTTYTDKEGVEKTVALSAQARQDIEQALQKRIQDLQKTTAEKEYKAYIDLAQKRIDKETEWYLKRLDFELRLYDMQRENQTRITEYAEQQAARQRDVALRRLEMQPGARNNLQAQVNVEQQRASVEIQYARQVHDVKMQLFDEETGALMDQLQNQRALLEALHQDTSAINDSLIAIAHQRELLRSQIDEDTQAAIDAAKDNATVRQMQIVRDEQQKTFDSVKRSAEGVFDALLTRSKNTFSEIGNIFKQAILTAIKEVISSRIAMMFMELLGGMGYARQPGAGGQAPAWGGGRSGFLGTLSGILPILGGGGGMPGGGGWLYPGTPGFNPNAASPAAGGGGGLSSILGGFGASGASFLSSLKNLIGLGGGGKVPTGAGAGAWGTNAVTPLGQPASTLSKIGHSDAMLLGGAILGFEGLKLGGISGMVMDVGAGAMIGEKFGGPVGAAIGAGVGLVAGLVRLFVKGATEKARDKIKATYGVDIKDRGVLQQIVDTAKSAFGGNLDMAIRSQQIADMVRLYAMSTGQNVGGLPAQMTPSTLIQTSTGLFQQPTYSGGVQIPSSGALGTLPGSNLSAGPSNVTVLNLSIPGAKQFFEQETLTIVTKNGKVVQGASMNALTSNYARRELTSLQQAPGALTS